MGKDFVIVRGILHADGTLELAGRPNLPAGSVEVTIRRIVEDAELATEGYWPRLQRIRARREAEGFPFRTKEEIDAEMEDNRSWGERHDELPPQADDSQRVDPDIELSP